MRGAFAVVALAALASLSLACATPVGVDYVSMETVARELSGSLLTGDVPSAASREYLARLALADLYAEHPREALESLRSGLGGPDDHDRLFALSELSFGAARRSGDRGEYLASAVYAYAFLFPKDASLTSAPLDGRLRVALGLYDFAIANALATNDSSSGLHLDFSARTIDLPFGKFVLSSSAKEFRYGGYRVADAVSLIDVTLRGLRNRYRRAGIGTPLAAKVEPAPGSEVDIWVPPQAKIPLTAFVRMDDPRAGIDHGNPSGTLELYDPAETQSLEIDGRPVATESEPSAALAFRLEAAPVWDFEIAGFRRPGLLPGMSRSKGLAFLSPYRRGRIPVVFVHGTASSPARWAEMANELLGDPRIASRYQLWFFIYNSGQPVLLSASMLRDALLLAVHGLDPQGKDPALQQMVVIGHSQGGLLTKLQVVKGGEAFWDAVSEVPFTQVDLSKNTRDLLEHAMFFDPLPFVTRVIFISTPHRGSFLAENWLGMLARRLVNAPAAISNAALELGELREKAALRGSWHVPTAIDNMDWSNPGLRTLYSLPIAPWVHANSIIPVKTEPAATANDGVVRYESAHIEPVESELIVFPSGHSTQSNPRTIEEVRRILYEHAGIH
jgi:triacylglycerol esterase/lipase EstA (alpha/beta hydrolase family)